MDLTTIIVAVVTGLFSLFTIILQRRNTKDAANLDEKNKVIRRKNILSNEIARLRDDANELYQQRNQLILDTNFFKIDNKKSDSEELDRLHKLSDQLSTDIKKIHDEIDKKRTEFYALDDLDKT